MPYFLGPTEKGMIGYDIVIDIKLNNSFDYLKIKAQKSHFHC